MFAKKSMLFSTLALSAGLLYIASTHAAPPPQWCGYDAFAKFPRENLQCNGGQGCMSHHVSMAANLCIDRAAQAAKDNPNNTMVVNNYINTSYYFNGLRDSRNILHLNEIAVPPITATSNMIGACSSSSYINICKTADDAIINQPNFSIPVAPPQTPLSDCFTHATNAGVNAYAAYIHDQTASMSKAKKADKNQYVININNAQQSIFKIKQACAPQQPLSSASSCSNLVSQACSLAVRSKVQYCTNSYTKLMIVDCK